MSTPPVTSEDDIATLREQHKQLQAQQATGSLATDAYTEMRSKLELRILNWALKEAQSPRDASAELIAPDVSQVTQEPKKQLTWRLLAILGGVVLLVAIAGYSWVKRSSPTSTSSDIGMGTSSIAVSPSISSSQPHPTDFDQIAAMTDKLAAKLKDNPQDGAGWAMLARSYGVLGNFADAVKAYEKSVALIGDDPVLLADYADALALKNKSGLAGEPMKLVERALKSDPRNTKALSLAGTYAFDTKNYKEAIRLWEMVVQIGPATDPLIEQAQTSLAEARNMVGQATPGTTAASAPSPLTGSTVTGVVKLSPSLLNRAKPDDTLFVFARPTDGSRMPLAILRKQVKDLPLQFTLDDSSSMSPNARLSTAGKVIVSARISKTGNALPETGDLTGQSAPQSVGAQNLTIEIRDIVKP